MSGPQTQPEGTEQPTRHEAPPLRSSVAGVFAGTTRGARIGSVAGTCVCFMVMMSYAVHDLASGAGRGVPLSARLGSLAFVSAWFGVASLVLGGIVGAILGAMIGTLFPVRKGPS